MKARLRHPKAHDIFNIMRFIEASRAERKNYGKINILFDEKNYSIDEAALAPATDALKAHIETLGGGGSSGDLDITLDGAVYKVDSTKLAPATNSLIAHLETLKGGGLAEGETYTLKTNLHDIDPNNFMKTPDPTAPTEGIYRVAQFNAACALSYMTAAAIAAVSGGVNDANTDGWMLVDLNNNTFKTYIWARKGFDNNNTIVDNDYGWLDFATKQPVTDPITVTISAFDESFGGYSLDELAVFFDLGGGSGNDGDTKITINGVEHWVDSTKLAEAKSALHAAFEALEDTVSFISFTIDGTTYQAEEGMTWGEWVESDYNNNSNGKYRISGNYIYRAPGMIMYYISIDGTSSGRVLKTDDITDGYAYSNYGQEINNN